MIKNYICIFFLSLTVFVTASDHGISNMAEETLLTHKTPTCGCCKEWIKHLKKDGFNTYTQDHENLEDIKEMFNECFRLFDSDEVLQVVPCVLIMSKK